MRRTVMIVLVAAACLAVAWAGWKTVQRADLTVDRTDLRVLVAHAPDLLGENGHVLDAWVSVLEEEGMAVETVGMFDLQDADPKLVAGSAPALILPDAVCSSLYSSFGPWLDAYLQAGGSVLAAYDAGVKSRKGSYLPRSWLAGLTGVLPVDYATFGDDAYGLGALRFSDAESAELLGAPPGKLDDDLCLTGYSYGRLAYPTARSRVTAPEGVRVLAWVEPDEGGRIPAITARAHGAGLACYVSLPLGHLKAHADDLPLRMVVRWWLLKELGLPHLMPTAGGVGGVVFNWHIDANTDWTVLDRMHADGFFREDLPASIHVCAGPDLNEPDDAMGFDACGAGRDHLERLLPYGAVGSHGGWEHNRFAVEVEAGRWGPDVIRETVVRNNDCLASVSGRPVTEYSAPAGVHPPFVMAEILEDLGVTATYYTGDSGSAPNRTFAEGRRVSDSVIHFPVMPMGAVASFGEMDALLRLDADSVAAWLNGTTAYCERERTVRLVYSHPYNLYLYHGDADYRPAFGAWLDDLESRVAAGSLRVGPMGDHAAFLSRLLDAEAVWTLTDGGLRLDLTCDDGLHDVAFAVPADRYGPPSGEGLRVDSDGPWHRAVITSHETGITVDIPAR